MKICPHCFREISPNMILFADKENKSEFDVQKVEELYRYGISEPENFEKTYRLLNPKDYPKKAKQVKRGYINSLNGNNHAVCGYCHFEISDTLENEKTKFIFLFGTEGKQKQCEQVLQSMTRERGSKKELLFQTVSEYCTMKDKQVVCRVIYVPFPVDNGVGQEDKERYLLFSRRKVLISRAIKIADQIVVLMDELLDEEDNSRHNERVTYFLNEHFLSLSLTGLNKFHFLFPKLASDQPLTQFITTTISGNHFVNLCDYAQAVNGTDDIINYLKGFYYDT